MASALDIIRVIADMTLLGQQILNVYHMVSPSAVSDDDVIEDGQTIIDDLYGLLNSQVDNELTYNSLRFFNVTDNQDMGIHDWPTLTVGGASASCLPLGIAGLITLPTAVPKVRGRKFFAGLSEGAMDNSLWVSGLVDILIDMGAYMVDAQVGTASGEFWTFGVPTTLGGGFQLFQAAITSNIPAYQRRRKQGVGA